MRWLCISDIHGDGEALAAVLATAERTGYSRVIAAGDLCFPGPEPLEVWRRLNQVSATLIQGLGDRALVSVDPQSVRGQNEHERARLARLAEVRAELGESILVRLGALPESARIPLPFKQGPLAGREILVVHGSPADSTEPFTHDMTDAEMLALVGDDPADIIVCGGSHTPFDRAIGDLRIINVGSVGEAPTGGAGRHADATFLELSAAGLHVEQVTIPLSRAA